MGGYTGDTRVAYNPTEKAAIERYKARVFCVTNAYATAEEKAAWFLNNLEEIAKACLEPPPGCWQVRRSGIRRVLPSGGGRSRPQPQWMLPFVGIPSNEFWASPCRFTVWPPITLCRRTEAGVRGAPGRLAVLPAGSTTCRSGSTASAGNGPSGGVYYVEVGEDSDGYDGGAGPVGGGDDHDRLGRTRVGRPAVCRSNSVSVTRAANGSCGSFMIRIAGGRPGFVVRWRTGQRGSRLRGW